jgi:hypothetical protein
MTDEQKTDPEVVAASEGKPEELSHEDLNQVAGGVTLSPILELPTPVTPVIPSSPSSTSATPATAGWDIGTIQGS